MLTVTYRCDRCGVCVEIATLVKELPPIPIDWVEIAVTRAGTRGSFKVTDQFLWCSVCLARATALPLKDNEPPDASWPDTNPHAMPWRSS